MTGMKEFLLPRLVITVFCVLFTVSTYANASQVGQWVSVPAQPSNYSDPYAPMYVYQISLLSHHGSDLKIIRKMHKAERKFDRKERKAYRQYWRRKEKYESKYWKRYHRING